MSDDASCTGPHPWDKVVSDYTASITNHTPATQRLESSQLFLGQLVSLTDHSDISEEQCTSAITNLIRVTLDSQHTTTTLRNFLLAEEVVTFVRCLITVTGTVDFLVQAFAAATKVKGMGCEYFANFVIKLLTSWIDPAQSKPPLNVTPGFVCAVFTIICECDNRQKELTGKKLCKRNDLDNDLLPLIHAALWCETAESINSKDERSYTALHRAVGLFHLPSVTQALLTHPGIDVNVREVISQTPLVFLSNCLNPLAEKDFRLFLIIVDHPDLNVSIRDDNGKNVIDHLCHHLTDPDSEPNVALQMIQKVCQHKTVTTTTTDSCQTYDVISRSTPRQ